MKTSQDPRHIKRIKAMQDLFAWEFSPKKEMPNNSDPLATTVISKVESIDTEIQKSAPSWPINQINKIDLAILRLATYELLFEERKDDSRTPYKVIVDEAVELAKEYGSENSSGFVNGVLGAMIENHNLQD